MKKSMILKAIKIIFVLAFVFQAISCSNIIEGQNETSTVEASTQNPSGDKKLARLSVSVQDKTFESENTEKDARTIRPNVNKFKFTLDAQDPATNTSITGFPKDWNSYDSMKGATDVAIEPGTYNFTLTIKDSDDNEIYTSKILNKEVSSGDNSLVFTIEESGTGNLKITVVIPKDWDIVSAEIALYDDISSEDAISGTKETYTVDTSSGKFETVYEKTLDAGTYILKCKFTSSDGSEVSKGYMDVVQIKNNFSVTSSIEVASSEKFDFSTFATKPGDGVNLNDWATNAYIRFTTSNLAVTISDDGVLSCDESYTVSSSPEVVDVKIISKKTGKTGSAKIYIDNDLILSQEEYRRLCTIQDSSKTYETITQFEIPYGYKGIEAGTSDTGVFDGSTALNKVILPETMETIGDYAFYGLSALNYVGIINGFYIYNEFPKSVKSIGSYAFAESGIKGMKFYNNVETIGDHAYYKCTSLTSIALCDAQDPDSSPKLQCISDSAFEGCTEINSYYITIPISVKSIGDYAFAGCKKVSDIQMTDSVENIGKGAFAGCQNVTSVTIPDSVENISEGTFYGCTSLKYITMPNTVKSIGKYAFSSTAPTYITIPNSVETIGENAFYGCTSLTSAYFNNKTGWKVYDSESDFENDENGTAISFSYSSSDNATYLTTTYVDKFWGRGK